ncbi:MAG: cytochrome c oxidase subunit II [Bacteroidetes bacterium]|nr:cytochrome c oxidase subunit II [Bacteroidota bacterium]
MSLLIIIGTIAAVVAIARLMKVLTLSQELTGEDPSKELKSDIKANAMGMLAFMVVGLFLFFYMIIKYMPLTLPVAASEHGVRTDNLLNINFLIIIAVFIITQIALFWFIYKYRYREGHRAYFYPHNNTVEVIWTVIPTIVLAGLVVTGLNEWVKITSPDNKDGMNIQVYSQQFVFVARYAGKDNELGSSFFRRIEDNNPLGLDLSQKETQDDIIAKDEMHFVVNKPVMLNINSRDVIHSVYLPHFRTQMNAVPGMTTNFYFKPTITTAEMRKITGNSKFDYVLLCNKICGVSHYMMKMKVVVDTQQEFDKWIKTQSSAIPKVEKAEVENNQTKPMAVN